MSDIILDTLVEKVSSQDKSIQELKDQVEHQKESFDKMEERMSGMEKEQKSMLSELSFPIYEIQQLSHQLSTTSGLLKQPLQQEVQHHHYLNRAVVISIVLFNIMVILCVLLTNAWDSIGQNRESDIKYRYLKLWATPSTKKQLRQVDSLYQVDANQMRKLVIKEEAHQKQELERKQELSEKEREVKQLKEKIYSSMRETKDNN